MSNTSLLSLSQYRDETASMAVTSAGSGVEDHQVEPGHTVRVDEHVDRDDLARARR